MNPKLRLATLALALSGAGFFGITQHEGFSPVAYRDGGGVVTIGLGTTEGVKMGDTITLAQAEVRARQDISKFEGAIKTCVKVPLYQHEYDAYVNLAYNIGSSAFCGSTIVKRLNAQNYEGACEAILMWKKVGDTDCSMPNKICRGLWLRRLDLRDQCLGEAV